MIYGTHRAKAHSSLLKGKKFPKQSFPSERKASRLKNTPPYPSAFSPASSLWYFRGNFASNPKMKETRMMAKPEWHYSL